MRVVCRRPITEKMWCPVPSTPATKTSRGPDSTVFERASTTKLEPFKFDKGLAFMFETSHVLRLTEAFATSDRIDSDYYKCWQSLLQVLALQCLGAQKQEEQKMQQKRRRK